MCLIFKEDYSERLLKDTEKKTYRFVSKCILFTLGLHAFVEDIFASIMTNEYLIVFIAR